VFERFTDRARRVVVLAQEQARDLDHGWIGTEHLLIGLLADEEGTGGVTLRELGLELGATRQAVVEMVGSGESGAPAGQIPFTPRAKRVLELSLREAISLGSPHIGTEHIALGLMREGEGIAAQVARSKNIGYDEVRAAVIARGDTPDPELGGSLRRRRLGPQTSDRISLKGIEVFARHGVEEHEKETGQIFVVDAELELDLGKAGESDDLADTVSYWGVAAMVASVVANERWNLIERVAERVAEELLSEPRVRAVTVTVHKPNAPMPVKLADVAVTIRRRRG
jgi:dihydroneopterin aldolase